jgi:branched-chain amino acid transport system substrate-binding protein
VRGRSALGLLTAAALLGGCGAHQRPGDRIHGHLLTIYFSGPMTGASSRSATAALNGAEMALNRLHARIGPYRVRLRLLNDAAPQSDGWDPNQTTLDARSAAQNPTTVGYLGDFNSGASAISIPLLNRARIPQVSPGSMAVGLTSTGPGASPGEPEKYYPTGVRTFARVVPTDADQARVLVDAEETAGCSSTSVLEDGEVDGEDAALSFLLTAQSARLRVISVQAFQPQAPDYTALARGLAATAPDCVLISATDEASAARLSEQVAHALPRATLFAIGLLANTAYVGALTPATAGRVIVVSPALPLSAYPPAGRAVLADYARRFGDAEPWAIFGYEAMSLVLSAITRATDHGRHPADRSKVRDELISDRRIRGVLGSFTIDPAGDISLRRFAIYRVRGGRLVFSTLAAR